MSLRSFIGAILDGGVSKILNGNDSIETSPFYSDIFSWIKNFDSCPEPLCHVIPAAFIFDYKKSAITYISSSIEHITGYNKSGFLEYNGIIKFIDLINPNDFKIYNEQIFPREMAYLGAVPYNETKNIIFSTTLRVRQNTGHTKTLLMKKCFIVNEQHQVPIYEFCVFTNISEIKKELSLNHTIEKFQQNANVSTFQKIASEDYFPEMEANILSAREKEILINLSLGSKRKDVGTKLFITDNTVANHIKTILRKTNTKNIREAIAICKMNGII